MSSEPHLHSGESDDAVTFAVADFDEADDIDDDANADYDSGPVGHPAAADGTHGLHSPAAGSRGARQRTAAGASAGATPDLLLRLMHDVQSRRPQAFQRLHALTRGRLFTVILRINNDRAESEDLLQDVFVKVWQQCDRFDGSQGDVSGWLAAIAHNTAVSSLRRRSCRPQPASANGLRDTASSNGSASPAADPGEQLPCGSPGPLGDAIRSQVCVAVRSGLMRLNVDQRESLQLAFFEGLSHQEIATRLKRPLGTVKSTVRRALLAMRPALHGHCADGAAG